MGQYEAVCFSFIQKFWVCQVLCVNDRDFVVGFGFVVVLGFVVGFGFVVVLGFGFGVVVGFGDGLQGKGVPPSLAYPCRRKN